MSRSCTDASGAIVALGVALTALSACTSTHIAAPAPVESPPVVDPAAGAPSAPALSIGDAVPRLEARSRYGNPPFYEVLGKRYYVLSSSTAYLERGVASWYGPGFHKVRTSTGELYDMYGMTAAHKTLPLPAYVRVTNLLNGRSAVVRVNDRGPFVGNRLIDLSYAAAVKLDMLRTGTAMVEVRSIDFPTSDPSAAAGEITASSTAPAAATGLIAAAPAAATDPTPPGIATSNATAPRAARAYRTRPPGQPAATAAPLFVQAGAFADPKNAERLAAKLRNSGNYGNIFVRDDLIGGRKMYRVRIGPVPDVPEFDRVVAALESAGVHDAHLALN